MTHTKKSLDEMLREISFEKIIRSEYLIPIEEKTFPEYRTGNERMSMTNLDLKWLAEINVNAPYLYCIIKEINKDYAEKNFWKEGNNFLIKGCAISLAFENAFMRGNKSDLYLPVYFKTFKGEKGGIIRIEDSGEGFDFKDIIKRAEKNGQFGEWYQRAGCGILAMINSRLEASYEGKGDVLNIKIDFNYRNPDQIRLKGGNE